MAEDNILNVEVVRHTKYLARCLDLLPEYLSTMDSIRTTLLFFGINGLSTLQQINAIQSKREAIIDWLYGLQTRNCTKCDNVRECGFKGSYSLGNPVNGDLPDWGASIKDNQYTAHQCTCAFAYNDSHLAGTYTALCSLLALGDDLARVDRPAILASLSRYQLPDGAFSASAKLETESDVRFVYCACATAFMLDGDRLRVRARHALREFDESAATYFSKYQKPSDQNGDIQDYHFDIRRTVHFILSAQTYEGGFAQHPGAETHGGSTYCAVAALSLLGVLSDRRIFTPRRLAALRRWLVRRQPSAFAGRVNKEADSCYTFWIGATLRLIEIADGNSNQPATLQDAPYGELTCSDTAAESTNTSDSHFFKVNMDALCLFLNEVQDTRCGGFQKCSNAHSDPMHTCLSLVGLSILTHDDYHGSNAKQHTNQREKLSQVLQPAHPALNMPMSAYTHLRTLHKSWSSSLDSRPNAGVH